VGFQVKLTRNTTKTSGDYADVLRTPADILGGLPLVIGMMVAVHLKQGLTWPSVEFRFRGRYWVQSGHGLLQRICLLLTKSGHWPPLVLIGQHNA
jgi:hypothetical protein